MNCVSSRPYQKWDCSYTCLSKKGNSFLNKIWIIWLRTDSSTWTGTSSPIWLRSFGASRWFKNESGLKSDYVTKKCTRPITELNKPLIFPFNSRGFQTFRMYYVRMYFIQYQASLKPLWLYDIFILFVALLGELVWSGLI